MKEKCILLNVTYDFPQEKRNAMVPLRHEVVSADTGKELKAKIEFEAQVARGL